ncbi:MAG: hydrogenase expression/formation protein HypE, partial [Bacteroidales bacterium]
KIVKSMAKAAKEGGIMIVTGDTKVVERGKCDGIYISTSGIGSILPNLNLSPKNIQHGDAIIVTAPIAEHGIAILTSREKLGFEGKVKSDTAPLRNMIINLLSKVQHISAIRDATRGGVATVLNEIASISKKAIIIDENILPISKHVAAASALLGLDPLYIANEGVMVVFVPEEYASTALSVIREDKYGKNAVIIGKVIKGEPGEVYLKTIVGTERNLPPLLREQLPRIC